MRDADVRCAVRQHLSALYGGDADTRIVEEMGVWSGTVRIDVAVINGELTGFELKSDRDTLQRLPYQIEIYNKVFDRVTLVVGRKLSEKALTLIPEWWGCLVALPRGNGVKLKRKRMGRRNPSPDPFVLAQMLWKEEAVAVLEMHGLAKGWRTKPALEISRRLAAELPLNTLASHIRRALKERQRLGQLSSRQLNMPIDRIADPSGWATPGNTWSLCGDGGDHPIGPTVV